MMMEEIHQPRMRRARATRLTTRTRLWRLADSPSLGVLSTTSVSASRWGGFCFSLSTEAEERDDYFSRMAAVGGGAEAMFSSGCASCCYKQGQGWTQGEEATVMLIENMEIYNCKGEVQLSCVHVVLSKEMSLFRSTMIPPHRFHPISLHPGWCRQCKEYLLFVFSITVIAKAFVVLYVIRLNLRVRVRFDLKSTLR